MNQDILEVFCAHRGIISVVGAGGKKTTMFRLVSAHQGRVGITTTVHTPPFRKRLGAEVVIAEPEQLFEAVSERCVGNVKIAYAHPSDKSARLSGVLPDTVSKIHNELGFDVTILKGDGARLRWIKAPQGEEPPLPRDSSVVVPVISIRVLGKPLSGEVAHRAEIISELTEAKLGDRITAVHLARLLSNENGGLKNTGKAKVIPVINMVENNEQLQIARSVATQVFDMTSRIDRVVIAAMERSDPIVDVVER